MKGRDYKSKKALIKYLEHSEAERFWQAIGNFAYRNGLARHFLLTSDSKTNGTEDLFYQESDKIFINNNKEK